MAKNRNKNKRKSGAAPMDVSATGSMDVSADGPQAMDTSEGKTSSIPGLGPINGKIKKGMQVRRSKGLRKQKAIARAISNQEKIVEKVCKSKNKMLRIHSAKSLYE